MLEDENPLPEPVLDLPLTDIEKVEADQYLRSIRDEAVTWDGVAQAVINDIRDVFAKAQLKIQADETVARHARESAIRQEQLAKEAQYDAYYQGQDKAFKQKQYEVQQASEKVRQAEVKLQACRSEASAREYFRRQMVHKMREQQLIQRFMVWKDIQGLLNAQKSR